MYHSISNDRMKKVHPYYETSTSPYIFAQHMKYLYENGYQAVTLREAICYLSDVKRLKEKIVIITFDDGFRDFYTEAFPVLNSHGFSATVFLPTAFIKNDRLKFKDKECLSWNEVRKLHNEGIMFGSHTVNHPKLSEMSEDDILFELMHSKEQIENEISGSVESFSYPFAFPEQDKEFVRNLLKVLKKCGYKYGVTTRIGTSSKRDAYFFLKRLPVNFLDDSLFLQAKLEGAYDWIYRFQLLYKSLKRLR